MPCTTSRRQRGADGRSDLIAEPGKLALVIADRPEFGIRHIGEI